MASMNWLGFSLYPQEHSEVGQISATDQDAVSSTLHHSLNLPPSFGIFPPHQDWSTKGNYNNQTLLLGTSCNNEQQNLSNNQHQPKLENFLGQHSFNENHQEGNLMFSSCSLQLPAAELLSEEESAACENGGGDGSNNNPNNTNSIGLSMIKSWLRNQPPQQKSSSDAAVTAVAANISLSMSTVSQPTSSVALPLLGGNNNHNNNNNNNVNVDGEISSSDNNNNNMKQQITTTRRVVEGQASGGAIVESAIPNRKAIDTFGQRTSIYRGVTRHRWTGRYEAHLWDNSCRREGQTRKGRQVYLGGYDKEEKAARAYDLAALKYWGTTTTTNFPISNYEKEVEEMKHMTRQEYIASLRRKSSGFSRGASIYRGVTRHHQHGRWQARIGRVAGNKDLYLGTFSTQEEAAEAYDIAAIKFRGLNAVTNFEMSRYDVKSILESTTLPIGAGSSSAKRLKDTNNLEQVEPLQKSSSGDHSNIMSSNLSYGAINWPNPSPFQHYGHQILNPNYTYGGNNNNNSNNHYHHKFWCKQEVQDHVDAYENVHHHQLQLGNTHNFFHHHQSSNNSSGVHSFMSIDHNDSASIDNNKSSVSSNPVIYNDGGYMMNPIGNDGNSQNHQRGNNNNEMNYENVMMNYCSSDPYHARNLYYLSQQQSSSSSSAIAEHGIKGSDQFDACNNNSWVPTAIPTLAATTPPFTLLNQ